jgi:hypothetical protein
MCAKSHSIAVSALLLPVASRARWHRISGNPIPASCDIAAASNIGWADSANRGGQRLGWAREGQRDEPESEEGSSVSPGWRPERRNWERGRESCETMTGTSTF